jgi:ribosomal protein S18 acetylase RimI-like enzyme
MTDKFRIEPFDPQRHDRQGFASGVPQVDNFLQKTAKKLTKADNLRIFVLLAPDGHIAGFHALNAHAVHFSDLPAEFARNRPGHGQIPAAFIAMLGRDARFRGQGLGAILIADALTRVAMAAQSMGIAVVLLDVLDCDDPTRTARRKALYESYGFKALPSQPQRLFLPLASIAGLTAPQPK